MFINTSELAALVGLSPRAIRKAISKGTWRGCELNVRTVQGVRGGSAGQVHEVEVSSLPPDVQEKIKPTAPAQPSPSPEPKPVKKPKQPKQPTQPKPKSKPEKMTKYDYNKESLWAAWDSSTESKRDVAKKRLSIINEVESLIENGCAKNDAIESVVGSEKRASVFRWYSQIAGIERTDWLPALLAGNTGRLGVQLYDEELYEAYKTYFLTTACRTSQHSYALAVEEVLAKNPQAALAQEVTLRRRLNKEVDPQTIDFCRNGQKSVVFQNPIPPQRRDKQFMWAMQTINGDGYDHQFYVVFPDGEEAKPTTWFWQDVYSGMIMGWASDKSENSDMLRLALKDVIEKWGLGVDNTPFTIIVDNTRAASAKIMTGRMKQRHRYKMRDDEITGIYARLGASYQPTLPYSGQSKPIERKFGIGGISHYVDKHPLVEKAKNSGNGISWDVFQKILVDEVERLNTKISTSDVCAGVRSPQQVFQESMSNHIPLRATKQQINMLLMCATGVPISKHGGINFMGNGYYSAELNQYAGKRMMIEYDPYKLRDGVNVYTLEGRFVCTAECTAQVGFHDTASAREQLKLKRQQQKLIKESARLEQKEGALRRRQNFEAQKLPEPPASPDAQQPTQPTQKVVGVNFNHRKNATQEGVTTEEQEKRFLERMARIEEMHKRSA